MKYALLLCLFLLASCSLNATAPDHAAVADPREQELRGIIADADPLIRNLLSSLNTGNYKSYSRDFDAGSPAACTEEQFLAVHEKAIKKLGLYEDGKYQVNKIEQYSTSCLIFYFVKFRNVENRNPVLVTLRVKKTAAGLKVTEISYRHSLLESHAD